MRNKHCITLTLCAAAWTGAATLPAAEPIPADQLLKLHALIKPAKGEEKWTEIPWRTNLWRARQEAAKQGKPILLWEMDGHPLGCV
jgi:hypothetical protein